MRVLGFETSCDETGVALYDSEKGLLANVIYSQVKTHAQYGGVVPEIASRDHIRKLAPLLQEALAQAGLTLKEIDAIAYTAGPGLIGALLTGSAFAKSLGFSLQIPTIAVHHMEAHLLAPLLESPKPDFPFLALLVSGGHTLLVHVTGLGNYQVIGESVDDAVGEAFDKTAKLLGLGYPGGATLEKLASQGNPKCFHFPRPMLKDNSLNFSFSGLKTHSAQIIAQHTPADYADIARAFQDAVVDILTQKCKKALQRAGLTRLVIGGGVAANQSLRASLSSLGEVFFPRFEFCTDNAAMIAFTGALKLAQQQKDSDRTIQAYPRWELT